MSMYTATIASSRYVFGDLKTLLAKASPARSGDQLAGITIQPEPRTRSAPLPLVGRG